MNISRKNQDFTKKLLFQEKGSRFQGKFAIPRKGDISMTNDAERMISGAEIKGPGRSILMAILIVF